MKNENKKEKKGSKKEKEEVKKMRMEKGRVISVKEEVSLKLPSLVIHLLNTPVSLIVIIKVLQKKNFCTFSYGKC